MYIHNDTHVYLQTRSRKFYTFLYSTPQPQQSLWRRQAHPRQEARGAPSAVSPSNLASTVVALLTALGSTTAVTLATQNLTIHGTRASGHAQVRSFDSLSLATSITVGIARLCCPRVLASPYARRSSHNDKRIRSKRQEVPEVWCRHQIWQAQLLRSSRYLVQQLR